jgi:hypothetical protein
MTEATTTLTRAEGVLRITNLSSTMKKPFEHWITF